MVLTHQKILSQEIFNEPFEEARKAMEARENRPRILDSLKRVYEKRWTVGLVYGQRYISGGNRAELPDTITFTDFTQRRSFYGIEASYFVSNQFQVHLTTDVLLLPREEEISTIQITSQNGINVEGTGSGGIMFSMGMGLRYHFIKNSITRPYLGLQVGAMIAGVKGGTGGFSTSNGNFERSSTLRERYTYASLMTGFTHRFSPGFMSDFNMGYTKASESSNIGGIISPGGFSFKLILQFIIGSKKNVR
jgi:hypothetical protein